MTKVGQLRCTCGDSFSAHGNPAHACDAGGYTASVFGCLPADREFRVVAVIDGNTCDACLMWHDKLVTKSGLVSIGHHCENENGCRCVGVEVVRNG